ncbi:Prenyltransferase and squalene oxidase repeat-containing protein [Kibdelosporangium aridum]|uniref:Prenyltransferase and squalene oxidase repeat-containing protein n=1 Tax=Kibdelosporangium aridum TaxID=2030 RepID=A0A1Y5YCU2_KIBAR|nr:Prenyltransferase and squalene oxidase repeat-containing protein [Kibdelosporangium aridum]
MVARFPGAEKVRHSATALVADMASDPYGLISPSIYETARVVTLARSLAGHWERVRYLLASQHQDGHWGELPGYELVPTLSATEALLSSSRRSTDENRTAVSHRDVVHGASRGLRALRGQLGTAPPETIPDTVAAEIVIPALVAEINKHLDWLGPEPIAGLEDWRGIQLGLPQGADDRLLARLHEAVRLERPLSPKLWHSFEAMGASAQGTSIVRPVRGAVGCSPAATAAWLGNGQADADSRLSVEYLEAVQERSGGPVPVCAPVPVFERVWVLAAFITAGVGLSVPDELVENLHAAFGEFGVAGGPGLPPDSDDTSTALYVLVRLGRPRSADCLWSYQDGGHFSCFPDERTSSTTTNAHVLRALGEYLALDSLRRQRYLAAMDEISAWLRDQQQVDGSWRDKWHASSYYATAQCAVALARYGGAASAAVVSKAVAWVLSTQRLDGAWGVWTGTQEETAYAVQILLLAAPSATDDSLVRAAARGCTFLLRSDASATPFPPLWHDKDLYTPVRVVRAERLSALYLGYADPRVAQMIMASDAEQQVW